MRFDEAVETVEQHGIGMVLDPRNGINGMAVGTKEGGILEGAREFCVTAFVSKKLTEGQLGKKSVRRFDTALQEAADSSAITSPGDLDVVEVGDVFRTLPQAGFSAQRGRFGGHPALLDSQRQFQSLRCGIGVTNAFGYPSQLSVGTAGFYMRDEDDRMFMVSNNHVIGRSNNGLTGETITQPGTLDLTDIELLLMPTLNAIDPIKVGALVGSVPIRFPTPSATPHNAVDAAIAEIDKGKRGVDELDRLVFGGSILSVAEPYTVDEFGVLMQSGRVYKVGRTTGYTEGAVTNIAAVAPVDYSGGTALFTGQIAVESTWDNGGPFSDRGDSGSGVLNDRHELVGLLFAGTSQRTLMNPIDAIIHQLRVSTGMRTLQVVTN